MLKHGYGASFKRVILRMGRTDLRLGIDKLAALLELEYGIDPAEGGTLYLFCGSRLDRIKGLLYDEDGYILLTKRLTNGSFQWPRNSDEAREMSEDDFNRLMEGYTVESSIKTYPRIDLDETDDDNEKNSHEDSDFIVDLMKAIEDVGWTEKNNSLLKRDELSADIHQIA